MCATYCLVRRRARGAVLGEREVGEGFSFAFEGGVDGGRATSEVEEEAGGEAPQEGFLLGSTADGRVDAHVVEEDGELLTDRGRVL